MPTADSIVSLMTGCVWRLTLPPLSGWHILQERPRGCPSYCYCCHQYISVSKYL